MLTVVALGAVECPVVGRVLCAYNRARTSANAVWKHISEVSGVSHIDFDPATFKKLTNTGQIIRATNCIIDAFRKHLSQEVLRARVQAEIKSLRNEPYKLKEADVLPKLLFKQCTKVLWD